MKSLVLLPILACLLCGCASPVVMKNPANGEVAQCYSGAGIIRRYSERDACVEQYEKLGWVKAEAQ